MKVLTEWGLLVNIKEYFFHRLYKLLLSACSFIVFIIKT